MSSNPRIKRALISVYDKTGLLPLAKALQSLNIEILSTGGTAKVLSKEGIKVTEVSEVTRFPEMLSGRVKTLHPNIHGGLLALRDDARHMETLAEHNIKPIDLVVVNLYPFWDAMKTKTDELEIIEMIDIGGPSMLRSAAKNFRFVASVSDPKDYAHVIDELKKGEGRLSDQTRRHLASKVFRLTSGYDEMIHTYLSNGKPAEIQTLPANYSLNFEKIQDLRYGENPHQAGAVYREKGVSGRLPAGRQGVVNAEKLHGKELSFNNLLDLDAAWELVNAFSETSCAIIKHMNPCGFAVGKTADEAFKRALACDPLSSFGGIIGLNAKLDVKTANTILKGGFIECIIAKDYDKQAVELLKARKNLRLLRMEGRTDDRLDFKRVSGGLLLQEPDETDPTAATLKVVTKLAPTKSQIPDLLFSFKVCRYVRSNAIVIAKNGATLGLGMGQPSRVDSCETAFRKAGKNSKGAVLASDGFFPKPDSIALAKKHGISAIIQPGGSIQDAAVIAACDKAKIAMVFTGVRHFKH